ncbi:hypothetical protein [Flavihumibacter profundi]|jgi:hypothetical protein|uniref:hypothetical protein n=1 Tax=Flavihumibacter profundi TaxID=2716883 RepID=UPI001CC3BDF4|nr:hypothetical protein [Flavihumibacter profundi]MBZ5858685.1 hypothetical protein [Flavihumibacter profundi]
MQKLLIISFLSIHIFGNTELGQVFHLPYIAIHYFHHIQSGDKISFSDFVSEHYGKGDNNKADDKEEQNLPFMQVHFHAFSIAIIPFKENFNTTKTVVLINTKSAKFANIILPVGFFGTLLKPPRTTIA